MNSQIVTVNLVPGLSTPAVVRVSQYDYGRPIVFNILDGTQAATIDSSATITVVGTKPSGLGFSETALTISGGAVTLNTTLAMTQESGLIPAEIRIEKQGSGNVGTANFILAVEKTPHADGTTDGSTEEARTVLEQAQAAADAAAESADRAKGAADTAAREAVSEEMTTIETEIDGLDNRITALEDGGGGSGLTQQEKNLILELFSKAAYAESDSESAYDALENLWTTTTRTITYNLSHVSSSNTTANVESGQSYTTTLTATGSYTLNTVTVTMGGVDITSTAYSSGTITIPSVTGNIVITATAVLAAQSVTATYTQSGTVYDTDTLDSLKDDLVVTANYSGGTSETVSASAYTLSGTLTEGTSTITVSYAGLTDTFDVTVTHMKTNPFVPSAFVWRDGYYVKTTGTTAGDLAESTSISVTEMFDISGFTNIRVDETTGTALRQYRLRFYSTNDFSHASYISAVDAYIRLNNETYPSPVDISIPNGANYCVIESNTTKKTEYADGWLVLTAS